MAKKSPSIGDFECFEQFTWATCQMTSDQTIDHDWGYKTLEIFFLDCQKIENIRDLRGHSNNHRIFEETIDEVSVNVHGPNSDANPVSLYEKTYGKFW